MDPFGAAFETIDLPAFSSLDEDHGTSNPCTPDRSVHFVASQQGSSAVPPVSNGYPIAKSLESVSTEHRTEGEDTASIEPGFPFSKPGAPAHAATAKDEEVELDEFGFDISSEATSAAVCATSSASRTTVTSVGRFDATPTCPPVSAAASHEPAASAWGTARFDSQGRGPRQHAGYQRSRATTIGDPAVGKSSRRRIESPTGGVASASTKRIRSPATPVPVGSATHRFGSHTALDVLAPEIDGKLPPDDSKGILAHPVSVDTRTLAAHPGSRLKVQDVIPRAYISMFHYESFNIPQSALVEGLMNTNHNAVIAAPTGCGKTACLEMALVRSLAEFDGAKRHLLGKVVYIAPMKALCEERYKDWEHRLRPFGLSVCKLTGGSPAELMSPKPLNEELRDADVIISTPEKWDSITRRWIDFVPLIGQVRLLCIDEVHVLNEDRGAALEVVVSRMRTVSAHPDIAKHKWPAANLRIVALSATVPPESMGALCSWLGCVPNLTAMSFADDFRPVPLETHVLSYDNRQNSYMFLKVSDLGQLYQCSLVHDLTPPLNAYP